MNFLPRASGTRPRLACEIFAGGVVAARSAEPGLPLEAVARVPLADYAVVPSLKPGNIPDRVAVIAAVRRALEQVGGKANGRNDDLTVVIPDGAVRVLLLDFDSLPNKLSEALPIVRFRLKKLVPFETDDAMVSFQVMSTSRTMVRVLAVAIPRDVLSEYESVAREAGFEPGAVLPSTVATLAALDEGEGAALVVNGHALGVTTAIVRSGIVLLHRAVEMAEFAGPVPANLPAALFEGVTAGGADSEMLPLVNRDDTAGEWAAQQPLPEHGRTPYADRLAAEAAAEAQEAFARTRVPSVYATDEAENYRGEPAPVTRSPYAGGTSSADLDASLHNAILVAPTSLGTLTDPAVVQDLERSTGWSVREDSEPPVHELAVDGQADEIARAVSVAVAYFEDSLGVAPQVLLSAGSMGAEGLARILREQGVAQEDGLRVRELVEASAVAPSAVSASVPRGVLAGVLGALKS